MSADIDIDCPDRNKVLSLIQHIVARQGDRKHNSGIYVTKIPYDPLLNCAAIEYKTAEERGYFKIDLLNVSVYQHVRDEEHLTYLMKQTPPWERLWTDVEWAKKLIHIGEYTNLLTAMKPDSIPRLAAFISIIRPGKAHLQGLEWDKVFETVWDGDDSKGFIFKKSHAISYSMLVTLHMNILNQ